MSLARGVRGAIVFRGLLTLGRPSISVRIQRYCNCRESYFGALSWNKGNEVGREEKSRKKKTGRKQKISIAEQRVNFTCPIF